MAEIVVIGAGVMGASVAFRLAQAGAAVTILEATRVGGGTSGISFAWTNANNKPPRPYHDLNVAGMQAHRALAHEFGATPWWHGGGRIEWVAPAELAAQREKIERLQSWGYAAEWIDRRRLAELEPDLDPDAPGDAPIAFFPEDGWLDPVPYAHAMIAAATRRHGAKLVTGVRVRDLDLAAGRVTGVIAADGQRFGADMVVNCAGRWANDAVAADELHLPLAPTVGFLALTPPVAAAIGRVIGCPIVNLRPDGAGRLMLHRDEIDATLSPDAAVAPGMDQARELMARAMRLLPGIGRVDAEAARITLRPIPRDHFSAVGKMPRVDGYYLCVSHSGVTLSPFLGIAAADEIVHGRERPELASFRPARFFN